MLFLLSLPNNFTCPFVVLCCSYRIQHDLKQRLVDTDELSWNGQTLDGLRLVGGVDISFVKDDNVNAIAALVILSFPSLKVTILPHVL